jgi:hypothetical protein
MYAGEAMQVGMQGERETEGQGRAYGGTTVQHMAITNITTTAQWSGEQRGLELARFSHCVMSFPRGLSKLDVPTYDTTRHDVT